MKSRILKIGGFIVALIIVLIIGFTLSIDSIIKSNIEQTGSRILETELSVGRVSLSIFGGNGRIDDIRIANPEGFEEGDAMVILSVDIKMEPFSIFTEKIVINELEIKNLEIFYNLKPTGSNLGQLRNNVQTHIPEQDTTAEKFIVIDRFLMEETSLTVNVDLEGVDPVSASLQRVEHTGIGRDEETDISTAMKIILETILTEAAREGRNRLIEEGGRRLLDEAGDALRDLFD